MQNGVTLDKNAAMSSILTPDVIQSIEESVLCWLATLSEDSFPNVSPKEAFIYDGEGRILIANIASPITAGNIARHQNVCVSFVDVFTQKGFKVKGTATDCKPSHPDFKTYHQKMTDFIGTAFLIESIFVIEPTSVHRIIAPSYVLYPESTELDRIQESFATYNIDELRNRYL